MYIERVSQAGRDDDSIKDKNGNNEFSEARQKKVDFLMNIEFARDKNVYALFYVWI